MATSGMATSRVATSGIATPGLDCEVVVISLGRFQFYVGGHSCENAVRRIVDANLYAKNLVDAFFPGLHVAGKKLGLLIDLLDGALKTVFGNESTRISAFWPNCTWPISVSGM